MEGKYSKHSSAHARALVCHSSLRMNLRKHQTRIQSLTCFFGGEDWILEWIKERWVP